MLKSRVADEPQLELAFAPDWKDYELLDTGAGAKLERFGPYSFVRPEPQAMWRPALPQERWDAADAVFQAAGEDEGGRWKYRELIDARWVMNYKELKFWAQLTPFRHLGVFPEQANHWDWMRGRVSAANRPIKVLNLFGYTGLASLAIAQPNITVTHVDASKKVIAWARENQALSKLEDRAIRWIADDALKFVQREHRRGARYDGLIIDPPKFGRGPKGEVWKLEESLPALLDECRHLLSAHPLFVVLTAYAIRASALSLYFGLEEMMADHRGSLCAGELATREQSAGRVLSNAIFARWSAEGSE